MSPAEPSWPAGVSSIMRIHFLSTMYLCVMISSANTWHEREERKKEIVYDRIKNDDRIR